MISVDNDSVRKFEGDMSLSGLTQIEITPRTGEFEGFGTSVFDFDSLSLSSLEWNTSLQSPVLSVGMSLFTPTGSGFEF
jgi:hypothetical protein